MYIITVNFRGDAIVEARTSSYLTACEIISKFDKYLINKEWTLHFKKGNSWNIQNQQSKKY